MKKTFITLIICCITLSAAAQSFSPFVLPLKQTFTWNSIQLFDDSIFFNIGNAILNENFSNRVIKVSKDLKHGIVVQKLNVSIRGSLKIINKKLIGTSRVDDFKNSLNGQFTLFDNNSTIKGPFIIGDTSNEVFSVSSLHQDIVLSGDFAPNKNFGWSGFLARYSLEGQKIWEKYYRFNRNGFKTTSFDNVFHTKNNELLVIGKSQKDSAGMWQTKVITALFDTSGNLLELKSELDSLGRQFDNVYNMFRLPRLNFHSCIQLTDSTFALLLLNNESQLNFSPRWLFFNDKGNFINSRKAWLYRDTVNNPILANIYFKGLIKKKNGIGYYAQFLYPDSVDRHRMVELDEELYITKIFPGIPQFSNDNILAGLFAFVEDEDKSFYQLRSFNVDSISPDETLGSLVCKVDSNGHLLSNGPLFPVGVSEIIEAHNLLLYPNPTHDKLSIAFGSNQHMSLEIYNTQGKLMRSENFLGKHQLDMREFTEGMYLFKFSDDRGNTFTRKVMKE